MCPEKAPVPDRRKRRRIMITAVVLGMLALAFYVGAFLIQRYFHSPAH